MTASDTFSFLGIERRIATAADWNRSDWPKLWLYNAHYFDDLVADHGEARTSWHRALIIRWIAENPPVRGNGWEPYPLSLRIVNWVKWLLMGNTPVPGMLDSLATQVRWLRGRLEFHLLGNHLWANAKALVFAGVYFDGEESEVWLRHGLRLIECELRQQVLADGGHFERSPMYHSIVTEDLLDLLQLARNDAPIPTGIADSCRSSVVRMLEWAGAMAHPDGELSFFNDAAFGIAPTYHSLRAYADSIGLNLPAAPVPRARFFQESGYARLESGPAVLLADVAPIGPDYLPGHAHADSLSFELSLRGQRMLVNGGTSTYEDGPERWRQRGTNAHNTIEVDETDSSEVWSAFRVARRARVHDVSMSDEGESLVLSAWHDGYRRLRGKVIHHRRWRLYPNGLDVDDVLEGRFREASAHYLFAPGATLTWKVEGGEPMIEPAIWHPRFGEVIETTRLTIRITGAHCRVSFSWD